MLRHYCFYKVISAPKKIVIARILFQIPSFSDELNQDHHFVSLNVLEVYYLYKSPSTSFSFDSNRNMESLDLVWVSRANAKQRKGRAGRVMPGVGIHLYTSHRYHHHLLEQPVPEIHRIPLEQLLLKVKILPLFERMSVHEVLGELLLILSFLAVAR